MKKEKVSLKNQLTQKGARLITFVSVYRVTIMIVAFGAVVGFSLYRAQSYSNPVRNEAKYEELIAGQKVTKINTELIDTIKASVDDDETNVDTSTAPGRTDPFTE